MGTLVMRVDIGDVIAIEIAYAQNATANNFVYHGSLIK